MLSAAEAELSALFINAKEAVHICNILTKIGAFTTTHTHSDEQHYH
jgi:hypothetical protein